MADSCWPNFDYYPADVYHYMKDKSKQHSDLNPDRTLLTLVHIKTDLLDESKITLDEYLKNVDFKL